MNKGKGSKTVGKKKRLSAKTEKKNNKKPQKIGAAPRAGPAKAGPEEKMPADTFDAWIAKQARSRSKSIVAPHKAASVTPPKDTFQLWLEKQKPRTGGGNNSSGQKPEPKNVPDTFDSWISKQPPKEVAATTRVEAGQIPDTYDEWLKNQKPRQEPAAAARSEPARFTDTFDEWVKKQVAQREKVSVDTRAVDDSAVLASAAT